MSLILKGRKSKYTLWQPVKVHYKIIPKKYSNMIKNIVLVLIILTGSWIVLSTLSSKELKNSIEFEGCIGIFQDNKMPAEAYTGFMVDCLDNN